MTKMVYRNGKIQCESKFKNKKTIVDGMEFDSGKEASRWKQLKILEKAGKISNLECQKKYELIPNQRGKDGKVIERACQYFADFCYTENGETIVEDVKSEITRKQTDYVIKRKLMLWIHHIRIREVE